MAPTTRITLAACLASGCFAPVGNEVDTSTGASTGAGTGTGTDTSPDTGTDTPTTGEPSQCAWKDLKVSGPSARAEHSMVYDSDRNQILLFGGIAGEELSDLWIFAEGKWTQPPLLSLPPPPRKAHAAAYDPERKVMVVFGGLVGLPKDGVVLGDTQIYDPMEKTWNTPAPVPMPAPTPRFAAAMVYHEGNILLVGGNLTTPNTTDNEHWSWNGSQWTRVDMPMDGRPSARALHMLAEDPSGKLILHGGCPSGAGCQFTLDDTWSRNGTTWTMVTGQEMGGQLGAMVLHLAENRLYRIAEDEVFVWDSDNALWSPPRSADLISGRYFAVAYHSSGLVRFGGTKATASTWVLECQP